MSSAENTRNFYRNQGINAERERIIKLLESVEGHGWIEIQFDKLIELIKGEVDA